MTFVNLTPHTINVRLANGSFRTIEPSGTVARVSSVTEVVKTIEGINIVKQTFGEITGLPEFEQDTYYIVSRMVKDRLTGYDNVLVPGAPIRDEKSVIIGADGLSL